MAERQRAPFSEELSAAGRIRLATFLSPAFPVGAFSYSHGLEWTIESGAIGDADTLSNWIADLVSRGSLWSDTVLFKCAHEAAARGDLTAIVEIGTLAEGLAPSAERHLETMAMGEAFLTAIRAAWPGEMLSRLLVATGGRLAYPVAVGAITAGHGIAIGEALPVYLNALAANLVSVAVRLVPLGQSEGLRVLAGMETLIVATAGRAAGATLDNVGSATIQSDIASMKHETQYSRVFRT